jgi:hypothetical protein
MEVELHYLPWAFAFLPPLRGKVGMEVCKRLQLCPKPPHPVPLRLCSGQALPQGERGPVAARARKSFLLVVP